MVAVLTINYSKSDWDTDDSAWAKIMGKITSKPFLRMAKTAANDALVCLRDGYAQACDDAVLRLLNERKQGRLYCLADELSSSSNFHGRISFGPLIDGEEYPVNLTDCWKARCLSAKFREQEWLCMGGERGGAKALFEGYSVRLTPTPIHELALDACKLYACDQRMCLGELTALMDLFELRQDMISLATSDEELEAYDLSVGVSLLLGRDNPDMERLLSLLTPVPVFEGIGEFWMDDSAFARFTERAAQWHFDYSNKNMDGYNSFAKSPVDILIPSWLLALDKFRQNHFGKASCLGSHELLNLGVQMIAFAKTQNHPKPAVFAAAEQHYADFFGTGAFNPIPFWEEVLGV